jgi:hypothetical protein
MRKDCEDWAKRNNKPLPNPDLLEQLVLTRDMGDVEIDDGDSDAVKLQKTENRKAAEELFDFFVDVILPAAAGKKSWGPEVRCYEPVSTSKIGNKNQLRITAATEAMGLTIYRNCRSKWNAMIDFRKTKGKGVKFPKYKEGKEENVEYRTPFTATDCGQSKYGGWNEEGRKYFTRLQKKILHYRKEHKERFAAVEKACYQRLQVAYNRQGEKPAQKKRKSLEMDDDDDPDMDCVFEE